MSSIISSETDHLLNNSSRIVDHLDTDIITRTYKEFIIVFVLFAFVVFISCLSLTYGTITADKILAITSVMMGMYSILKALFSDKTQLELALRHEKKDDQRHREIMIYNDQRHREIMIYNEQRHREIMIYNEQSSKERLFLAQLILSNQPYGHTRQSDTTDMITYNV